MKKLIPFIILTLSLFLLHSCVKANDSLGHDGRCTGSAYCTACTNCSRCGHCGSGGTCGVCSRSSSSETHKKSKPKKHKTSKSYTSSKEASKKAPKVELNVNVNSNNRYIAAINDIKIYEKPSFKSDIVTTVSKNAKLVQLSKEGSWIKVKVKSNGKIGYVDSKYVK
ncbi:SH3 domain-containing protein [Chryseobacterium hispalense]|uniref:SH3 domain-containing protein n=1 Tax=Chryseobacterium hispalense TaxID=1453492 RepID=UPI0009E69AEA|nr:SH3 domain-containing protein [Chryseobacterium hispalense]